MEIDVTAHGGASQRAASGGVSIGDPSYQKISVPFLAEHLGRISISSKVVVIKGETQEKPSIVTIADSTNKELRVVNLAVDHPQLISLKFEPSEISKGNLHIGLIKKDRPQETFTAGKISFGIHGDTQTYSIRYLIIW